MKKLIRKRMHKAYVRKYIVELQWDSLNTMLVASATQWNDDIVNLLDNSEVDPIRTSRPVKF